MQLSGHRRAVGDTSSPLFLSLQGCWQWDTGLRMQNLGCRTWHVASLLLLLHSTPPGQSSQSKPGAMWGAGEARWGEERALATNGPGCGSQWELAPLQSPPWVGALPGKAGSLCNMQTHCGSSTALGFAQRQVTGSPALKRKEVTHSP